MNTLTPQQVRSIITSNMSLITQHTADGEIEISCRRALTRHERDVILDCREVSSHQARAWNKSKQLPEETFLTNWRRKQQVGLTHSRSVPHKAGLTLQN